MCQIYFFDGMIVFGFKLASKLLFCLQFTAIKSELRSLRTEAPEVNSKRRRENRAAMKWSNLTQLYLTADC